VTLDPDVERLLKDEAHKRGQSFKVALNEAVRQAFRPPPKSTGKRKAFVVEARRMGLRAGIDPARLSELADEMENEALVAVAKRARKQKP
jgi:hypothetical protein